jgi:hypothetical protein
MVKYQCEGLNLIRSDSFKVKTRMDGGQRFAGWSQPVPR